MEGKGKDLFLFFFFFCFLLTHSLRSGSSDMEEDLSHFFLYGDFDHSCAAE
jgi:hypothetical protein